MGASEPSIGYLVKHAQALLRARMEEDLAPLGLTVSQYSCLYRLSVEPGISAAALARSVFMTRQSMGAMLQPLTDRGLVRRTQQADAGRALPIALTASGAALLEDARPIVDAVEREMIAELAPSERAALAEGLARCIAGLSR